MEKISPRVDIAFKKIFGVTENTDLLISLIRSQRLRCLTLITPRILSKTNSLF